MYAYAGYTERFWVGVRGGAEHGWVIPGQAEQFFIGIFTRSKY